MSYATIRDKIKTILEGVTGIGTVHGYKRWTKERAQFETLFKDNDKINTWAISRTSRGEAISAVQSKYLVTHTFTIWGRYSMKDATETEDIFQDLVDKVVEAFRGNETLDGLVQDSDSVDFPRIDHSMFGGYLVHEGEGTLVCYEPIVV